MRELSGQFCTQVRVLGSANVPIEQLSTHCLVSLSAK